MTAVNLATADLFQAEMARLHAVNDRLRLAINRLAMQDATLSVCEGNVTVTMDATLTDAEREAVERGYCALMGVEDMSAECTRWDAEAAATLRGLLERTDNRAKTVESTPDLGDHAEKSVRTETA